MSTRALWSLLMLGALSTGCTHSVHQLTMGGLDDIPRGARLHPIEVEADQDAFIAAGDTSFADHAVDLLSAKCPRGRIVGIEARYSTSLGFLSYTNRLKITGFCLRDDEAPAAQTASR